MDIGVLLHTSLLCCGTCLCVLFAAVALPTAICFMVISSLDIFLAPLSIAPARPVAVLWSCVCDAYSLGWRSRRPSWTDQRVVVRPRSARSFRLYHKHAEWCSCPGIKPLATSCATLFHALGCPTDDGAGHSPHCTGSTRKVKEYAAAGVRNSPEAQAVDKSPWSTQEETCFQQFIPPKQRKKISNTTTDGSGCHLILNHRQDSNTQPNAPAHGSRVAIRDDKGYAARAKQDGVANGQVPQAEQTQRAPSNQ